MMIKNQYLLFLISEILDRLVDAKIYTQLDLRDAYYRICIWAENEWKTAFQIWYRHFEYLILSFELINASVTFQSYINKVLSDLLDIYCVVYLDNIVIYLNILEEHVVHVKNMLEWLQRWRLYAKLSKCTFHTTEIGFLSFVITTQSIIIKKYCVDTILDWLKL